MIVQAEVSLYPLRTMKLEPALDAFRDGLDAHPVAIETGTMSSRIQGEAGDVFAALSEGFAAVAEKNQAVLIVKISNACPSEAETSSQTASQPPKNPPNQKEN